MSSNPRPSHDPRRLVRPPRPSSTAGAEGSPSLQDRGDAQPVVDAVADAVVDAVVDTTAALGGEKATEGPRVHLEPIPPPGEQMQYRAIGLIEGQYIPSAKQFTRGVLRTADGLELHAVLLGRVMSLVRKHLKPERNYLWVVYPRTREKTEDLHVQLLGVWAPEEMGRPLPEGARPAVVPDWFSIRGEVVFQSQEKGFIIVKILQAGKKASANRKNSHSQRAIGQNESPVAPKPQAFKLRLMGSLPGKSVGSFWDLQVRRRGSLLYVEAGTPIGPVLKGPPRPRLKRSSSRPKIKKNTTPSTSGGQTTQGQFPPLRDAAKVPKPVKKRRP